MSRNYYVICDDNCKFEGMTKEQIIAAIAEATGATPTQIDDAFITKVKESNHNGMVTFWKGTSAEFNALSPAVTASQIICRFDANGKMYIVTDDAYTPTDLSQYRTASQQNAIDNAKVDKAYFNSSSSWTSWSKASGASIQWEAGGYKVNDGLCYVYMSFTTTEAMDSTNQQRDLNATAFPIPLHESAALACQVIGSSGAGSHPTAQVNSSGVVTMWYGGAPVPANVQVIVSGFYPTT